MRRKGGQRIVKAAACEEIKNNQRTPFPALQTKIENDDIYCYFVWN